MKRKIKNYGWIPSLPDPRDQWVSEVSDRAVFPPSTDMRKNSPAPYDQKSLGSCTANACNALFQFTEMEQTGKAAEVPSRLYTYWNTRLIQGDTAHDTGASIKDTMKALNQYGVCRELIWPYMVTKFATRPSTKAFAEASKRKIQKYQRVQQTAAAIKGQLAQNNPIAFGFTVFESFEGEEIANTGMMKMPDLQNEGIVGGHAVSLFGYETIDGVEYALVRNSWGVNWGIKGWFYMPMKFLLDPNYCSDFWTMSQVPIP